MHLLQPFKMPSVIVDDVFPLPCIFSDCKPHHAHGCLLRVGPEPQQAQPFSRSLPAHGFLPSSAWSHVRPPALPLFHRARGLRQRHGSAARGQGAVPVGNQQGEKKGRGGARHGHLLDTRVSQNQRSADGGPTGSAVCRVPVRAWGIWLGSPSLPFPDTLLFCSPSRPPTPPLSPLYRHHVPSSPRSALLTVLVDIARVEKEGEEEASLPDASLQGEAPPSPRTRAKLNLMRAAGVDEPRGHRRMSSASAQGPGGREGAGDAQVFLTQLVYPGGWGSLLSADLADVEAEVWAEVAESLDDELLHLLLEYLRTESSLVRDHCCTCCSSIRQPPPYSQYAQEPRPAYHCARLSHAALLGTSLRSPPCTSQGDPSHAALLGTCRRTKCLPAPMDAVLFAESASGGAGRVVAHRERRGGGAVGDVGKPGGGHEAAAAGDAPGQT